MSFKDLKKLIDMMVPQVKTNLKMNDILALGIIKGLHSLGINVPEDISIIGFDNIKHSQFFIPGLTTINQDIFSKGEKAVDIIINKVSSSEKLQNETIISNVSLVERESVKKG